MEREDMTNVLIFFMIIFGMALLSVGVGYVAGLGWSLITFGLCILLFAFLAAVGSK